MPIPMDRKYTADEFFKLVPESNNEMYELRNGEIISLASPNRMHQKISVNFAFRLKSYILSNSGKCEVYTAPTDVMLDDKNVVIPDVFITCDNDKWDEQKYNGAPDFVVEILSNNRQDDLHRKLMLYQENGVREYWIVDPKNEKVLIYFFDESDFPSIYTFEQNIPVGIYSKNEIGLEINIAELLV